MMVEERGSRDRNMDDEHEPPPSLEAASNSLSLFVLCLHTPIIYLHYVSTLLAINTIQSLILIAPLPAIAAIAVLPLIQVQALCSKRLVLPIA